MNEPTDYYQQATRMRERLAGESPTLCLAKWLQVSIHLTNGRTQSCYHPPAHPISLEELAQSPRALHNTRQKKHERKLMKAGERPAGCDYCWKIEDAPGEHLSDRHYRSGEPWAREGFDEVVNNPFDYDINPRYVEINFNQACNFKCSYCSPHISSTWHDEIKKYGAYPTLTPHNHLAYFQQQGLMPLASAENPYLEAFWKWWPDLYKDLKVFRMTGGEPLMDKNTFRILDWINAHPKPELELAITSNMCPVPELLDKFIDGVKNMVEERKVKRLMLFPSVDSWGEQAEYIRHGMNFEYFWRNVDRYLTEVPSGLITFIVTMNCLSVPRMKELFQGFLELQAKHNRTHHRVFFDTPYLRFPGWQSLKVLPPEIYRPYFEEAIAFMKANPEDPATFRGFRDFQIARMERVYSWLGEGADESTVREGRINLYRFFQEHDRRRGTDFARTFPELRGFWDECRALSAAHGGETRV